MTFLRLHLVAALLFYIASCIPTFAFSVKYPQAFMHDGIERTYYLNIPNELPGGAPLIVALHGMGGQAHKMRYGLELHDLAYKMGFATLFPQGAMFGDHTTYWNAGEGPGNHDDLGFLTSLIAHVTKTHGLDPSQVYVLGISNGAQMAYHLACHASEQIAGIAAVIGTISGKDWSECHLQAPVSLLHIHGKEDPTILYNGAYSWYNKDQPYPAVPDLINFWVKEVGAGLASVLPGEPNKETSRYESDDGTVVELVTIKGFGHDWPNPKNSGFSASQFVADFFVSLSKK
jgi:polyhydroxybutyrate depolymerase